MTEPLPRVLAVDDEPNILRALTRSLYGSVELATAVGPEEGLKALEADPHFDVVLSDLRMPGMDGLRFLACVAQRWPATVRILLTGIHPQEHILQQTQNEHVCGYILKGEISNSMVWAVSMAMEGRWISTPGVEDLAGELCFRLPPNRVCINGHTPIYDFTPREVAAARLAFLFSMERRDLADEMSITENWTYGLVSGIYKKLGLEELLNGEIEARERLGDNPLALSHLQQIMDELNATASGKARDMETLAFHVMTMPEMEFFP